MLEYKAHRQSASNGHLARRCACYRQKLWTNQQCAPSIKPRSSNWPCSRYIHVQLLINCMDRRTARMHHLDRGPAANDRDTFLSIGCYRHWWLPVMAIPFPAEPQTLLMRVLYKWPLHVASYHPTRCTVSCNPSVGLSLLLPPGSTKPSTHGHCTSRLLDEVLSSM